MASGYDSAKTQLIAIYRLEFYKKKKNWKLYEDMKEPPPSPKSSDRLNQTYNVGEDVPERDWAADDQVSPHNKAFLLEEPDDTPDLQPPDASPPSPGADHSHNLHRPQSWPGQPYSSGDDTEPLWQDPQEWCGTEAEGIPDQLAYDQCDGVHQPSYHWMPASQFDLRQSLDPLVPPDLSVEYLSPAQTLAAAEAWLQRRGYPLCQLASEGDDYESFYESAEFVRGAHVAPHSSEIDLSITPECPCTCKDTISEMTTSQLTHAVHRHHAVLTLLLQEQALRDRLSVRTPRPLSAHTDCVLAGSHYARALPVLPPGCGRGRGRLQQASRLVGRSLD